MTEWKLSPMVLSILDKDEKIEMSINTEGLTLSSPGKLEVCLDWPATITLRNWICNHIASPEE